jgi:hypothetical protein
VVDDEARAHPGCRRDGAHAHREPVAAEQVDGRVADTGGCREVVD